MITRPRVLAVLIAITLFCSITLIYTLPLFTHSEAKRVSESAFSTGEVGRHNFGVVAPAQSVECLFRIRNSYEKTITPDVVRASCQCVSVVVERRPCAPGACFEIRVAVRTDRERRDFLQTVAVAFSDSTIPEMRFEVFGSIRPALAVSVQRLDFDSPNNLGSQDFRVENFSDQDWTSVSLSPSDDWMEIRTERTENKDNAKQSWRCEVSPKVRGRASGHYVGSISVASVGGERRVEIPCSLLLRPPLTAFPASWFASSSDSKEDLTLASELYLSTRQAINERMITTSVSASLQDALEVEASMRGSDPAAISIVGRLRLDRVKGEVRGNVTVGLTGLDEGVVIPVLLIGTD